MGCSNLKSIQLPESLKEIGFRAFKESGLQNITMPSSVRTIHQSAFGFCKNLEYAILNEGLETLGTDEYPPKDAGFQLYCGVFGGSALEHIELPSTLKGIEYGAFYDCKNLKNVKLPDSLERIGQQCFYGSSLENIVLPASVEEIGEKAFYDSKLREVVFGSGSRLKTVGDYAFGENQLNRENMRFPENTRVPENVLDTALDEEYDEFYEEEYETMYEDDLDAESESDALGE